MRFESSFRSLFSPRFGLAFLFILTQILFLQPTQLVFAAPAPNVQLQAGAPQLILTKSIEGGATTAQVGDVIRYRIRFECSSLTTSCGEMEITDVLQAGLTYLPPPNSSVPSGFSISETAGTISITKDDDNLLDGSQYDAVIAVRVNYDLRPLPAIINNTVTGQVDPPGPVTWQIATPASAPPITIGTVSASWGLTKTLFSPSINPTIDTDVTYQIELCPTTPPPGQGNVPLEDIVITDTLPAGAVFVSASSGGVESAGVVTWPAIAGPIYSPNCISRYVTIRYPSPTFSVGDDVENTADATADYLDSDGNDCPGCFTATPEIIDHPIDPILAVPTYNKNDAGDPVGINGTARFVLNLDTNGTNYPSNDVTLIDNLPPELQVTEVTSGGWSGTFDHVRAFVEYSTDYGANYTAFGTASYNTNATYTAPATNITNVRWRFEYDPDGALPYAYIQGLPYTWSFTNSPEIRVTPRAVATTADDITSTPMPAAVVDTTYNNCVQVSRVDNTGPVLDPCDNETMTVRGNYVSLRTSKGETNGASWDNLDDPNITVFTPDTNLLPGDTMRYTITVEVTERSSAPLIDPTIFDTIPADLIFVRNGTAQLDNVDLPAAQQPTFTQAGQNLTWAWSGSSSLTVTPLVLGSRYLTVEFFARIPPGQTPGTRTNNLYVVTDSVDVLCELPTQVPDATDVDGDTDSVEFACETTDTYVVERSAALRGEKWIRSTDPLNSQVVDATTFLPDITCPVGGTVGLPGGGGNPFTRFPCISQAFPEDALSPGDLAPPSTNPALDDFEYNLRIFNDGNVNMLNYVLYDILPYYGDRGSGGTLENSPRNSEFRPVLRGPIEFISGTGLSSADFTIEYNLTVNPCRPEVFNQDPGLTVPAGCDDNWTTDWEDARSYRIRLNPGSEILPAAASEVRFGVPMYIPADAPLVGSFNNDDPLSHEIAWNSFSHVGSYETGIVSEPIRDLLASEPRKVGITIPEVMSVGNRVWRDADNNGTINSPDDSTPGIAGVTVNLYRDTDNDGIPDGPAIETTLTDTEGYYLFSNIPYDSTVMANNRYIVGIPASNFGAGQPLESLRSSTGAGNFPTPNDFTNPPSNGPDSSDHGIDPVTPGLEVFSANFILQPGTEPTAETDLSNNDRDGIPTQRRGVNAERDNNSDLTLDFGFFGGIDVPFSIGNHLWYDNGQTSPGVFNYALRNDGLRQITESPVIGATVRLYRDGDANGTLTPAEMIRTDVTDANGFYLFDNLDPGLYYVEVPASNFATGQPLAGWYSSQPTGTETLGVNGGTATTDIDNDDNGINNDFPETNGIFSGVIVLTRGVPEPLGETYLSGDTSVAAGFNPTAGDGPGSIGRFGETDMTSNLTIDFGFIPPMSLGNRVWIDEGAGTTPFRTGYNNGLQDGTEVGVSGVSVQLWRDTNGTPGLQVSGATPDTLMDGDTTDATGYYLFERLQPASNYFVHIPSSNFAGAGALVNFLSSTDANHATAPADDFEDTDDNGLDDAAPGTNGITSSQITMSYNGEPLTPANETDINNSGTYGPQNVGNYGQSDSDSNLTMDFGFIRPPRSIGNRLWYDLDNDLQVDVGEGPVPTGVRVSLYLDADGNGIPDDVNGDTLFDNNDALGFDLTDANGYYLFDNLPPNRYIVGVDRIAFAVGGLLEGYNSSTGNVDNLTNNTDDRDNGVDRLLRADPVASPHGILSTSINLTATPVNAPTGEVGSGETSTTLGFNPTAGDGTNSRGRFGETDANSDLTIDFGFFIPMSLGNRVWLDDGAGGGVYNNGIMDGGETGIANVRVELWRDANANGTPDTGGMVGFDTTDANGYYLFDNLAEGSYVVLITGSNFSGAAPLVGRRSSTPTGTENTGVTGNPYTPNTDRDDNGINNGSPTTLPAATPGILSGTIVLAQGAEPTGETELSGQADPGSPTNLTYGPTGWDGPLSRGRWDESDNNSNLTIDFGFIPVFSLGNRVWYDTNNNSLRSGESGINNVRVRLYASDGTTEILVGPDGILNTADDAANGMLTAGGGYYRFNNLPAGDYMVKVAASNFTTGGVLDSYWSSGTTMNGTGVISETAAPDPDTTVLDTDDNGTLTSGEVISSIVTLGPIGTPEPLSETDLSGGQGQPDAQANMTVDFGFYRVELGNLVYLDNNANGTNDAGDTAITARNVRLYAADGTTEINVGPDGIFGTADDAAGGMVTNGTGIYIFGGLPQGQYIVRTASDAVTRSTIDTFDATDNASPDTNRDNNDNGIGIASGTVSSGVVTLTPGSTGALGSNTVTNATGTTRNPTVDFGFVGLVGLGNRVWIDDGAGGGVANNGILDGTEVGVNGVTLDLYDSLNNLIATTTSADFAGNPGYYQFDMLYPGTYYVLIPASEFQGGGDLFSYYSSAGAGANETSDQNADENGIDDNIPAVNGIRSNNFILLGGTESTADNDTGYTGTLADANVNFTDDFAFVQKYSLGNRVWFDTDNGSTINGAEVGVDGVTVNLYAAGNLSVILATDITSSGGYYLFDDLYPGDYVVSVAASNFTGVLNGYWSSGTSRTAAGALTETAAALSNSDTDSDDNGNLQTAGALNGAVISSTVTLGPSGDVEPTSEPDLEIIVGDGNQPDGRANMTVDFGFYRTEIGNLVFTDVDNSGHYNAGDVLLQGITVELYAGNGTTLLASTTTDINGEYRFDGQPEGDYVVAVIAPNGMTTSTIDTFDGADNANPDVNTDNNDNGIGEGSGTIPSGVLTMTAGESAANITVTNATGTTTDLTVDFGFVPLYSLGNRVWFDTNNNSLMNLGEIGVNGVTVQLYRADGSGNPTGAVIATDTTTGGGFYLFDDLYPRDYVVVIPQANFASGGALAGYWSSATSLTAGGALIETAAPDADVNPTDADDNGTLDVSGGAFDGAVLSSAITLGPGGGTEPVDETADQLESGVLGNQGNQPDDHANMTVDFGFYRVQLSNLIFTDLNRDGTYAGSDVPHVGAAVQLFASNGTTEINVGPDGILGTADDAAGGVTTGAGGTYLFDGLPQGSYIVKVTPQPGYTSTVDTADATDTTTPDTNTDNNDNGIGVALGQASSNIITLTPGSLGLAGNNTINNATGTTSNPTMDFGFYVPLYSLGNRVWFDTDNDSIIDGTEVGVDGVDVQLYAADGSGNPTGAILDTQTTTSGGYYRFDGLPAGDYVVVIPSSELSIGGTLVGYWSSGTSMDGVGAISETASPDPDNDTDSEDNGSLVTGTIMSRAVTLGPGVTEPINETDIASPNPAGEYQNSQSNLTVDFGFYRLQLSNQIFIDVNQNGTYDAGDGVLPGATVQLFAGNGTTEINVGPDGVLGTADDAAGGMTSAAGGTYLFSGLPQGDYIVRMTPPSPSYTSTIDTASAADTTSPNQNVDNNDNGIGLGSGQVSSNMITLTPGSTGTASNNTVNNATGTTSNPTMDFGILPLYSLGNRVWFDTDNSSTINGIEVGVDGVTAELYAADGSGSPTGAVLDTQTTANGGYYRFDGLDSGDYVVVIPSSEFGAGGTLLGYWSSGTTFSGTAITEAASPDPDNDTDSEDNGSLQTSGTFNGAVISKAVTLGPGINEPVGDSDTDPTNPAGEAPNNQSNLTVDFGFYRVELSNQIFVDIVEDGLYNAGDFVLPGAIVQLFASDGTTEIQVGPDGILGTTDDAAGGVTTGPAGIYLFSGLPEGTYVVSVTPPVNYSSTMDSGDNADTLNPNANTDDNDNGVGTGTGPVFGNPVTLTPGDASVNNTVDDATGTTSNPTLDFGFTSGFTKVLVSTDATHTVDPQVTIGEIITYEINMYIPVGTMTNVTLIDTPQAGLAFVDCIDIDLPANVTSTTIVDGACDANDGTLGTSNPLIQNSGGRATFDFGDITNAATSSQIITVRYSLIVLDIAANQSGDSLTNSAVWTWTGGTKTTNAPPVEIVEPQLTIDKNATPTTAAYGSIITFTIDIAHDLANSTADAFDVIVTDQIPTGLAFVPGSITNSGTATLTSSNYNASTNTLTFVWDVFRLNETASVSFGATFVGPAPVINSANVEWTSLLIDPQLPGPPPVPVQLSPYNPNATERWYDPASPAGVNNYAVSDSVELTELRPARLPHTGFAPNVVTELPQMPDDFAYAQTDLTLEIPQLKLKLDIVGVPFSAGVKDWDLKWLANNAGWLDGTAFPTHEGNSALTAHSTLPNGNAGPFANIGLLKYGDQIIVHLGGQKYIYEIRENRTVRPTDVASVLKHEEISWLTLITCKTYNEKTGEYESRTVVRAVLIKVVPE
jgi:LPXTG-site transpeptidase (sortase) family protein